MKCCIKQIRFVYIAIVCELGEQQLLHIYLNIESVYDYIFGANQGILCIWCVTTLKYMFFLFSYRDKCVLVEYVQKVIHEIHKIIF